MAHACSRWFIDASETRNELYQIVGKIVMRRTWLRWLALGTGIGVLACAIPWTIRRHTEPEVIYVLSYSRNLGPTPWTDTIRDPAPALDRLSEYPVQIAIHCKLPKWSISTNDQSTTDVDQTAWLRISASLVDDRIFNCLSKYVRPPFVRLTRGTEQHLRKIEMNFGEP